MIQILQGEPIIQPASTRIILNPSEHEMYSGAIYEFVYNVPDWGIITEIMAKIWEWWKSNVEGLEILGHYREADSLVFQVKKTQSMTRIGGKVTGLGILPAALAIIGGLAAILIIIGVFFLVFGFRLAGAGCGLMAAGLIVFLLASGYYKLLSAPLVFGGFYLLAKQAGVV